jgi:hypothetical protein
MRPTLLVAALFVHGFAGCTPGDQAPPAVQPPQGPQTSSAPTGTFDFTLTRTGAIDIHTTSAGEPLSGALVQIRTGESTAAGAGDVVWTGATGLDGHARATLRTERFMGAPLEVTVNKAGYAGTWTNTAARAAMGPFAPSARVVTSVAVLAALDLDLERSP